MFYKFKFSSYINKFCFNLNNPWYAYPIKLLIMTHFLYIRILHIFLMIYHSSSDWALFNNLSCLYENMKSECATVHFAFKLYSVLKLSLSSLQEKAEQTENQWLFLDPLENCKAVYDSKSGETEKQRLPTNLTLLKIINQKWQFILEKIMEINTTQ